MKVSGPGFFWTDPPKAKGGAKRIVPERTWERPDYLPHYAEALAFQPDVLTDQYLLEAWYAGERLAFDMEIYPNCILFGFKAEKSGKVLQFKLSKDNWLSEAEIVKLQWILQNCKLITFNGIKFDMIVAAVFLAHYKPAAQWTDDAHVIFDICMEATLLLIRDEVWGSRVLEIFNASPIVCDQIDLIQVCPLKGSLKKRAGQLLSECIMDLPFKPGTMLTLEQIVVLCFYNIIDLDNTLLVWRNLGEQIALREKLTLTYGTDVRSKSDAQCAEAIIKKKITEMNGYRPGDPIIEPGKVIKYKAPAYIQYKSELLQWVQARVERAHYVVQGNGYIAMPEDMEGLQIPINDSVYRLGMGGLHSSEEKRCLLSTNTHTLFDRDVTSYYPRIIINSGMYPAQLGVNFTIIFSDLVNQRIIEKKAKRKANAESLKILINGTFGKLNDPFSILYAPHLMLFVTLTGQLSLLMLIEMLEMAGLRVVSANTDGLVVYCPNDRIDEYRAIVAEWEHLTKFETEEVQYPILASRDVNAYVAVKTDKTIKGKNIYLNAWNDPDLAIFRFHKNPVNLVCTEAVYAYLTNGTPLVNSIVGCTDIAKFTTLRHVTGGGVKNGEYIGKTVRWYYAQGEQGEIIYAKSGNMVPESMGAKPCMWLPKEFPSDVNYNWYIREADSMLTAMGIPSTLRVA